MVIFNTGRAGMRAGIVAGAVVVAALAGCGSSGPSSSSAGFVQDQPSVTATLNWAQRACVGTAGVLNQVAGPLEKQDAAGVVAAGRMAGTMESVVSNLNAAAEYPQVVEYADAVLGEIVTIGNNALAYEESGASWSVVTDGEATLASTFRSLASACSAAGVTINGADGASTAAPVQSAPNSAAAPSYASYTPTPDPYSVGCPTSAQLLAAWNAAPVGARDSWFTGMTPTGFFGTECWHRWVVTSPVIQANGSVVFTDTGGHLVLLPEADLSELDAAICGVAGAPTVSWAGPGGPASCSQSG